MVDRKSKGTAPQVPSSIRVLLSTGRVTELKMETYIAGVVAAEMGTNAPVEALKAQAVASRTYAVSAHRHPEAGADVCTASHCQRWRPVDPIIAPEVFRAVSETWGMIATHEGKLIDAFFFEHCDGHTRSGHDLLMPAVPYLQSVECECGFIALKGHGVGLCQRGAIVMGRRGASFQSILRHYYHGVSIVSTSRERAETAKSESPAATREPAKRAASAGKRVRPKIARRVLPAQPETERERETRKRESEDKRERRQIEIPPADTEPIVVPPSASTPAPTPEADAIIPPPSASVQAESTRPALAVEAEPAEPAVQVPETDQSQSEPAPFPSSAEQTGPTTERTSPIESAATTEPLAQEASPAVEFQPESPQTEITAPAMQFASPATETPASKLEVEAEPAEPIQVPTYVEQLNSGILPPVEPEKPVGPATPPAPEAAVLPALQEEAGCLPARVHVDHLPGERMIAGCLSCAGIVVTIQDAHGSKTFVFSGSAPHYGEGGFETIVDEDGCYLISIGEQDISVDVQGDTIFIHA